MDEVIYGLDFGFHPDPTVLLKVGKRGMDLFIQQLIYDTHLTNSDLIARLKELFVPRDAYIYADSAEPDRIEEIYREGFNVFPADKGQGSVQFGIDVCKRFTLNIMKDGTDTIQDLRNYKYKADKNGKVISPPVPVHSFSHAPDAMRYPVATHWGKYFQHLTPQDVEDVEVEELETITIFRNY